MAIEWNLAEIRERYRRGENITALFREMEGGAGADVPRNSSQAIEIAYDMQAGSYVKALEEPAFAEYSATYCSRIADVIAGLGPFGSLLEVGVGEATTLSQVAAALPTVPAAIGGFDISWSRVAVGRDFARSRELEPTLFVGDLFEIPLADASVDVVYTSHSIEPNGGREKEALLELYRVANRHLVLLEPSNELGSEDTKARSLAQGYVQDLGRHARELGLTVLEHRLFEPCANPKNQTALLVIEKSASAPPKNAIELASPHSKEPLLEVGGHLYSDTDLRVYPVIAGIPCLRAEQGIVASHLGDLAGESADSQQRS